MKTSCVEEPSNAKKMKATQTTTWHAAIPARPWASRISRPPRSCGAHQLLEKETFKEEREEIALAALVAACFLPARDGAKDMRQSCVTFGVSLLSPEVKAKTSSGLQLCKLLLFCERKGSAGLMGYCHTRFWQRLLTSPSSLCRARAWF